MEHVDDDSESAFNVPTTPHHVRSRIRALPLCVQGLPPVLAHTRPPAVSTRPARQQRPPRPLARLPAHPAIQMHRLRTRMDQQENSQAEAHTHQTLRKETCIDQRYNQDSHPKRNRRLVPFSEHPIFTQ